MVILLCLTHTRAHFSLVHLPGHDFHGRKHSITASSWQTGSGRVEVLVQGNQRQADRSITVDIVVDSAAQNGRQRVDRNRFRAVAGRDRRWQMLHRLAVDLGHYANVDDKCQRQDSTVQGTLQGEETALESMGIWYGQGHAAESK